MYSWIPLGRSWVKILMLGPKNILRYDHQDAADAAGGPDDVLLFIPGNPGLCQFYEEFAHHLSSDIPDLAICVVSHTNHSYDRQISGNNDSSKAVSLRGQIDHKIEFVLSYVPKKSRLFLAGHSIGAYIILHMLKPLAEEHGYHVEHCFLLFPTFERMRHTPNGRILSIFSKYFLHYPALILAHISYYVPDTFKKRLARWFLDGGLRKSKPKRKASDCSIYASQQLWNGIVLKNVIKMALDELEHVNDFDTDIFRRYGNKMTLYYGQKDGWCPLDFYEKARKCDFGRKIVLMQEDMEHAFVIRDSDIVARIIAREIEQYLE